MQTTPLPLPPVFLQVQATDDLTFDLAQARVNFWETETAKQWFHDCGYTLYVRPQPVSEGYFESYTLPATSCLATSFEEDLYPFAYHSEHRADYVPIGDWADDDVQLHASDVTGRILYGQDVSGRHVTFKLARTDSDEIRISRLWKEQTLEVMRANCILPVLDILPVDDTFSFIVMPRWGDHNGTGSCRTYHDASRVIHSFLKALVFLHRHRVIHRDIRFANSLVNQFGHDRSQCVTRHRLRRKNFDRLEHAIMDFNYSILAPPTSDVRSYRLPYQMSFVGTFPQPDDVHQGEFEYNPFAFDVATMGIHLCHAFQHLSQKIRILAPLLDRMTTRNLAKRCTAEEALAFFEELTSAHPVTREKILFEHYERSRQVYYDYDKWDGLPADFVAKWSEYREPPVPRWVLILRWVRERDRYRLMPRVRWLFFQLRRLTFGV
ncbi:hypothetical protein BXZ70DRAFT_445915 [Cristinia sonorae]|uniref:Protein kinase domain-containing protein n=1 Tax=Cristinia sonorae TaxID=1940300 RepID=A0A8K0UIY0_9AGAR|nr:hypothetical protein BXZ70DRAFT_445915 [Cristinia sonorae]